MAKRFHRRGHGTGVRDYSILKDVQDMPMRGSLPQNGPERGFIGYDALGNPVYDDRDLRSDERKAWDEQMAELQKRMQTLRVSDATKRERLRKEAIRARVTGRPLAVPPAELPAEPPPSGEPQGRPPVATPVVRNGTPKASGEPGKTETPSPSLQAVVSTVPARGATLGSGDTGIRVNNVPVGPGDTGTLSQLKSAAKDAATVEALRARRERQKLQNDALFDERRRYQERQAIRDQLDANMEERRAAKRAEREKAYKARMDSRYASGSLSNEDDWRNLGREGSNRRGADERAALAKALQERMTRMADTTSVDKDGNYTNAFYANDPKRQRDLAALRKLVDRDVAGSTITDKQLDAVAAKLDKWEQGAAAAGERRARAAADRHAERVRQLRQEYGLTDPSFTDPMVEAFHKNTQEQARRRILQDMDVAPAQGGSEGRADRMARYADNWVELLKTGLDPNATFSKAMSHKVNQVAFMSGVQSIDRDDPERADKIDQLRRRFIVNQAMADAGLDDGRIKAGGADTGSPVQRLANYAADMARDLPGNQSATALTSAGVIRPVDAGGRQLPSIVEAQRARDVIRPRKRDEETQQDALGGNASFTPAYKPTPEDQLAVNKMLSQQFSDKDWEARREKFNRRMNNHALQTHNAALDYLEFDRALQDADQQVRLQQLDEMGQGLQQATETIRTKYKDQPGYMPELFDGLSRSVQLSRVTGAALSQSLPARSAAMSALIRRRKAAAQRLTDVANGYDGSEDTADNDVIRPRRRR